MAEVSHRPIVSPGLLSFLRAFVFPQIEQADSQSFTAWYLLANILDPPLVPADPSDVDQLSVEALAAFAAFATPHGMRYTATGELLGDAAPVTIPAAVGLQYPGLHRVEWEARFTTADTITGYTGPIPSGAGTDFTVGPNVAGQVLGLGTSELSISGIWTADTAGGPSAAVEVSAITANPAAAVSVSFRAIATALVAG